MTKTIPSEYLLNTPITCLPFEEQIMLILRWAKVGESRTVCLANVHMLMEAYWNSDFSKILTNADLVAPDGMPLVWMLRTLGASNQNRVAGMDVFLSLCNIASQSNISVFFLGSHQEILNRIKAKLRKNFPNLKIAGMESLPFRPLTEEEDTLLIKKINNSNAGITFVCLGCPKQEIWMDSHKNKIKSVMIGVGAVFEVYAGIYKRPPRWIRDKGFEWLYRLIQEPRRLWRRYSSTIPPFIYLAIKQLLTQCKSKLREVKQNLEQENLILDLEKLNTQSSGRIGEILVKQNLLTEKSLEEALLEQKISPNLKIGDILVSKDFITLPQLNFCLDKQNIKLGRIMVEQMIISQEMLEEILDYQKKNGGKLGEIMVSQKIITSERLTHLLIEQYWRKNFGG